MDGPTQVPPGDSSPRPEPPDPTSGPSSATPDAWPPRHDEPFLIPEPVTVVLDPADRRAERGLWVWFGLVALAMAASVVFKEAQFGLFAAGGGTFAVAHAAERVPRWRLLHRFLAALVTLGGALLFLGLILFLRTSPLSRGEKTTGIAACAVATAACIALLLPPVIRAFVRMLFGPGGSTAVTRLAARGVAIAFLMALPLGIAFRAMLALDMLKDMDLGGSSLWGSLLGLTLLSLGGVGTFVTRTPREALTRLGLGAPRARDLVWIPLGVAGLGLLNGGIEWAQRRWFPAQWAFDQHVVALMAGDLTRTATVMLGLSAGFGEELSMRGALQPRLGLVLTAVLFASLHVQYSWTGMLTIVGFGLALGWVRIRTSTTTAIAVHAIYDMLAAFGAQKAH